MYNFSNVLLSKTSISQVARAAQITNELHEIFVISEDAFIRKINSFWKIEKSWIVDLGNSIEWYRDVTASKPSGFLGI